MKSLRLGPRRWTKLKSETGLSPQGLNNGLDSLKKRGWIEFERFGKSVTYKINPKRVIDIDEKIVDDPFSGDRYSKLSETVEELLKTEKDQYMQYLMLHSLFSAWSNASLEWVDEMLTLAAIALLNKQEDTYRELRNAAERTFTRLNGFTFDLVKKHPVVAAALIDASTSRQEKGGKGGNWISELVDECYSNYERRVLPGESYLRSAMIQMAAKPFFQPHVATVSELRREAEQMRRQDYREGNPKFDIKSEKQIRKLLSVFGNRL